MMMLGHGTGGSTAPSILVLAEHTFFILDLSGHILVQRRLDHHPSCFWPYPAAASSSDAAAARGSSSGTSSSKAGTVQTENLLVATHSKVLQVYRGQQLAWAAQLELLPVAARVTSMGGVRGMIVALDDTGEFLGLAQSAHCCALQPGCMAATPGRGICRDMRRRGGTHVETSK